MMDVVLSKKESIERCIKQVREFYNQPSNLPFEQDRLKQDAIAINLQRMAEQAIALANHVIKVEKLGAPKDSRDSFGILAGAGIIPPDLARKMQGMVGLCNILVHEYQKLDLKIMVDVIENRLDDALEFSGVVLRHVAAKENG
jgi:uncharacterized protein YutE (UPF0331/DUF86 family)